MNTLNLTSNTLQKVAISIWLILLSVASAGLISLAINKNLSFSDENHIARPNKFRDLTLNSFVYQSCDYLIKNNIIKVSYKNFYPFTPINSNFFNKILKKIEKIKHITFPRTAYFSNTEIVTPKLIRKKIIITALKLGITPGMDNIPEQAFKDLSKINILSIFNNYLKHSCKNNS